MAQLHSVWTRLVCSLDGQEHGVVDLNYLHYACRHIHIMGNTFKRRKPDTYHAEVFENGERKNNSPRI